MQLVKWDLAKHTFSISASSRLPVSVGLVATNGLGFLASIDFNGTSTNSDTVKLYDLSNFVTPGLLGQEDFPTNQQSNSDFEGQVVFSDFHIWALDANNGLIALSVNGPRFFTFLTAQRGHVGNKEIIQALASSLHSNSLSGAKLLLKTTGLGTEHFSSKFVLRRGANDLDVSNFMPLLTQGATVTAETAAGTLTNTIDYAITGFTLTAAGLGFDVQGLGIWKSTPIINRGQTIWAGPFPNSIIVSSADGAGYSGGQEMTLHGSVAVTGRKIEIVANQSPTVSLTTPTNGQSLVTGNITLRANAVDTDGSVSTVEFYQDGNKLGETTSSFSFFTFNWTNAPAGTFALYAKAIDNDGASTLSATNTVTINPAP